VVEVGGPTGLLGDVWSIDTAGKAIRWEAGGLGREEAEGIDMSLALAPGTTLVHTHRDQAGETVGGGAFTGGLSAASFGGALCLGSHEGTLLLCPWNEARVGGGVGVNSALQCGGVLCLHPGVSIEALHADEDTAMTGGSDGRVHVVDLEASESVLQMAPHQV